MPFTRAIFIYGDPIAIPENAERQDIEQYRQQIEQALNGLAESGEASFEELYQQGRTSAALQKENE